MLSIANAQDSKDVVVNQSEENDDRDTAETIALIVSGVVVFIVIAMVCLYCVCSRMGNGESESKEGVT